MSDSIRFECPGCRREIVIDPETESIISSRAPGRTSRGDLDSMIAKVDSGKASRESTFERSMSEQRNRDKILEARFREAMERAREENDDSPPLNPMDLD